MLVNIGRTLLNIGRVTWNTPLVGIEGER